MKTLRILLFSALLAPASYASQIVNPAASGGSVNTGSANAAAYYASSGTALSGSSVLQVFTSSVTVSTAAVTNLNNQIMAYRKPNVKYGTSTMLQVETGNNGTAGSSIIIFPDGSVYTESQTALLQATATVVANWGNGSQKAGIRPTETLTNNSWYNAYVIKSTATANTTDYVLVESTYQPTQANFSTLNTIFCGGGSNCWEYLAAWPYGDNSGTPNAFLTCVQNGFRTQCYNIATGNARNCPGMRVATNSSAANAQWSYATGVAIGTNVPVGFTMGLFTVGSSNSSTNAYTIQDNVNNAFISSGVELAGAGGMMSTVECPLINGIQITGPSASPYDIFLRGWTDKSLSGGNPQL